MSSQQTQIQRQEEKIRRRRLDSLQQETPASSQSDRAVSNMSPDAGLMRKLQSAPKSLAPNQVLQLQRLVGNRTVQRLLGAQRNKPAQPVTVSAAAPQVQMLRVDAANTKYEEEADRIAGEVVQGKRLGIQRAGGSAPGSIGMEGGDVDDGMARQIKGATGGNGLPSGVRNRLEPKLGVDLKGVKVHTGAKSAQLNRQLNAKAFTYKNNIFYGAGQSPSDLSLTTHEVVHTMHQGAVHKKALKPEEQQG